MAEFDGLDSRLRDAFAKAAEQGDSTGVADAIRSRVAAGDSGTSVVASTAPGWGSGGGVFSWLPWLSLIVVGGLVGGALGASGAAGRPAGDITVDVPVAIGESAPAYSCVDGPVIGRLAANTRVLAVQRSDDSLWVGVRDPGALGSTVWVALGDVSLDDGTPALETLPIGGACPQVVVVTPTPEPPPPPADTTRPSISQLGANPTVVYVANGTSTKLTASVSDAGGVAAVTVSWSGSASGSAPMEFSGGEWSLLYTPPPGTPNGTITFTVVARDYAGNQSSASVAVQVAQ